MFRWSLIFAIVAIVAAIIGFGGIAADLAWISKTIFIIAVILLAINLIRNLLSKT